MSVERQAGVGGGGGGGGINIRIFKNVPHIFQFFICFVRSTFLQCDCLPFEVNSLTNARFQVICRYRPFPFMKKLRCFDTVFFGPLPTFTIGS